MAGEIERRGDHLRAGRSGPDALGERFDLPPHRERGAGADHTRVPREQHFAQDRRHVDRSAAQCDDTAVFADQFEPIDVVLIRQSQELRDSSAHGSEASDFVGEFIADLAFGQLTFNPGQPAEQLCEWRLQPGFRETLLANPQDRPRGEQAVMEKGEELVRGIDALLHRQQGGRVVQFGEKAFPLL